MNENSRSKHILELAKELLDDIELSRLPAESLLLKATRLARYEGSEETKYWLSIEMRGYNSSNKISRKYMGLTGRWTDIEKGYGYWGPLAQIEAAIDAQKSQLSAMRIPDSSGDKALLAVNSAANAMSTTSNNISTLSGIKSRVLGILHQFVSDVYYAKVFDNLAESIFDKYKKDVDLQISENCGNVLEQIPSVMDRLSEGDTEAISQALTTCRRIIDAFADTIYPPTDETIEIGGNTLSLKADKHQNRLNAYVHLRCHSTSRKKKIRQNIANIYDRVSTGIHNDVDVEEAKSLFLNTYLLVGEILSLSSELAEVAANTINEALADIS
ncbi:hypothetical protein [Desulfosporosinus sp.]|uniref:AbiTii domain-containing protein n=1 Tax=Desulfosporosinus sp. TaxID=157907 RepID=UPI0025B8B49F|nr:hypothetical protein [Desulfosporosinus sp.]MBC2724303.1 hypothetical protein [Desulfosporosinus sp.]MBC2728603.1 hypothetical protein [Desulfosporosinus sp.]